MKNKRSHLDWITLLLSLLAGVVWMFLGGAIMKLLLPKLWSPLVVGIYFGGLALVLVLVAWLCTIIRGFTMAPKKNYAFAALIALGIFVASMLFQWVYTASIRWKVSDRSSYIFLIDDSGSMWDQKLLREKAVRTVMSTCDPDFPYAVYSFADSCVLQQDIQPAKDAVNLTLDLKSWGGTEAVDAIRTVVKDVSDGRLQAGGGPRIILVTDGEFSELGLHSVLSAAVSNNISICTIGMPGSNPEVLRRIADLTNGVNVTIENLDQLPDAIQTVAIGDSTYVRTLLSCRQTGAMDWIFSILRIVFLLILGALFIWIKALLLRSDDMEANMLVPNLAAVLIGALCVEIGMNIFYWNVQLMQMVMCIGFTILLTVILNKVGPGSSPMDELFKNVGGPNNNDWGDYSGGAGGNNGGYGAYGGSGGNGGYGGYGGSDGNDWSDGSYGGSGGYGGDDWG